MAVFVLKRDVKLQLTNRRPMRATAQYFLTEGAITSTKSAPVDRGAGGFRLRVTQLYDCTQNSDDQKMHFVRKSDIVAVKYHAVDVVWLKRR